MFSQAATLRDVFLTGLDFDAAAPAFDILSNGGGVIDLQWSKIQYCAFKNARYGIRLTSTGGVFKNNFFQGCNISLELGGSDCFVQDNFVDTKHASLSGGIVLTTCGLSTVRGNFITGRHKIPLVVRGNCRGTRIYDNEFDISDYSGVFCDHARGFTMFANTFSRLQKYFDRYSDAVVTVTLGNNPFAMTSGSAAVTVTKSSGNYLMAGMTVNFSGATAANGITIAGDYVVTSTTDTTHFVITHGSAATSSGSGGGAAVAMTIPKRPAPDAIPPADYTAYYANIINPPIDTGLYPPVYADADFRAHNSYNYNLHDNIFMNIEIVGGVATVPSLPAATIGNQGDTYFVRADRHMYQSNGTAWEDVGPYQPSHKMSADTAAAGDAEGGRSGHDVYIDDVNYRDGKVRNINIADLNVCAPRLGSRHPAGILNVTTGSVTVRPGEYSVITVNLTAAATITIANYPVDCKDAETILINRRDTNAFVLTIKTGDAGGVGTSTTIKTFGSGVAGTTTAIYDGAVWFCT
jgi:hypothetical protein